jgi:ribosomal protein S18 acetylase RimI-like enzyme
VEEFEVEVAPLAPEEAEPAVRVLARAFRDNPLNLAVIGSDASRRERVNAAGLRPQLPGALEAGCALAARRSGGSEPGGPIGVLLGTRPLSRPASLPAWPAQLRAVFGQGWRVARRWSEVHDLLAPHRPAPPHWYLALLGVDPCCQRAGVGAALLAAFLREVDSDGRSAWLETDRAENVPFYQRAGFRTVGELTICSVPVWLMHRSGTER